MGYFSVIANKVCIYKKTCYNSNSVYYFFAGSEVGKKPLHNFIKNTEKTVNRSKISPFFLKLGFTPCKAEELLQGITLQEKEAEKS